MTKHPRSLDIELYRRVAWWLYVRPRALRDTDGTSVVERGE